MDNYEFIISEEASTRVDKFISDKLSDFSRSQVQNLIKDEMILVNNSKTKSNYKLKENDKVSVTIPEPTELEVIAQDLNLDIRYEDKDVIVVNKPSGMVVHPAPGHSDGTLVNGLVYHCNDLSGINGVMRPGIVHRIDKDTSGLLMVAKNDEAHKSLVNQLVEKSVTRKYIALVHGNIPNDTGTIDAPIGRDQRDRKRMTVTEKNSKSAVTHFSVLKRYENFTLIECVLETGRTHQIRTHMKYINYPIAGDPIYGPKKTIGDNGQLLHAKTLGFVHPRTNEYIEFEVELPKYFENILRKLR